MKIVIIGAGISGCTAYLQLKKHLPQPSPGEDHEFTIYEAYDTGVDTTSDDRHEEATTSATLIVGGGLGVGPNGLNVLKRLDEEILRDVTRGGYTVAVQNMKNKNGRLLMRLDSKSSGAADGRPLNMVACSRHSFWRCLRIRVPDHIIVKKRISEVVANATGRNVVKFVDGSPDVEADLVIGADGIRSTAKRALFAEAKEDPYPPHYEGLVGVGGFVPASEVREHVEKGSMNFIFGGNGFFGYFISESAESDPNRDSPYAISEPGDRVAWWSTYAIDECPDHKNIDAEDIARQLRKRHEHWTEPVVQRVIQSVNITNMYPTWTCPPLPIWERDGVVLVGDAAHALPSTSGQGSSQALEDTEAFALFLSHSLKKKHDTSVSQSECERLAVNLAAKRYTELRQPHVNAILENAQKMQNTKRDMGVVMEHFMYFMMWVFGLFPSLITKSQRAVFEYNVAEEVQKVLDCETGL